MEKISKILAPTDISELSQAGVRYALELAKAVKAELTVYHAVSQGKLMQHHTELTEGTLSNRSGHFYTQWTPTSRPCPGS